MKSVYITKLNNNNNKVIKVFIVNNYIISPQNGCLTRVDPKLYPNCPPKDAI